MHISEQVQPIGNGSAFMYGGSLQVPDIQNEFGCQAVQPVVSEQGIEQGFVGGFPGKLEGECVGGLEGFVGEFPGGLKGDLVGGFPGELEG